MEHPNSTPAPVLEPSKREAQILHFLALGCDNYQIARRVYLSEYTVKTHIARLLKKSGAANRTHLVTLAVANNWIHITESGDVVDVLYGWVAA